MLANAVSGPIGSAETSVGPPRTYSPQCYHWMAGAGCDVAVEEEGRGGAWRGDVLPRWRSESEEILIPFGLLQVSFVLHSQPVILALSRPWTIGRQVSWCLSSGRGEGVNVESLCEAAPVLALATTSPVGIRGSGSWAKGRALEAGKDRVLLPLSDATASGEGE